MKMGSEAIAKMQQIKMSGWDEFDIQFNRQRYADVDSD